MTWHASVLTLFPEMFPGSLGLSLAGRALGEGIWSLATHDLREHGVGRHRNVDDTPFGGGAGMVMRADVVDAALTAHLTNPEIPVIYPTPRGRLLRQEDVRRYVNGPGLFVLCGRYEGLDERLLEARQIEQVSIGDYVLSGGEPAALVMLDACIRLLPGVMGSDNSGEEESFSDGLLEYPQYTKPSIWQDRSVPDVLLSGHHAEIARWRKNEAKAATRLRRPELWDKYLKRSGNAGDDVHVPASSSLPH